MIEGPRHGACLLECVAKGFPFATNFSLNEISGLAVAKGCSKTSE
jgi:hypothetical protein